MTASISNAVQYSHQTFLELQSRTHQAYLGFQTSFMQQCLTHLGSKLTVPQQLSATRKNHGNYIQLSYLFDPVHNPWVYDHCPIFTRPALAMMTIADMIASQCQPYFAPLKLVEMRDIRVFQWVTVDTPKWIHTQIQVQDEANANLSLVTQTGEQEKNKRMAVGTCHYAKRYPQAPLAPQPVTLAEEIDNPYRYLFHGPTFRPIKRLFFGAEGSTMYLNAHNPDVPSGSLNHVLLDGATQGVYHEKGLSFWRQELPDNHICYPALLKRISFYSDTPLTGEVRCETRFKGFHVNKSFPIFNMTLIKEETVWCSLELAYAVLPMGLSGVSGLHENEAFVSFIIAKRYTPTVSMAIWKDTEASLSVSKVKSALQTQWFPHLIEDTYGIDDDFALEVKTKWILIKEFFARKNKIHPTDVIIHDNYKVSFKNTSESYQNFHIHLAMGVWSITDKSRG